MPVEVAGRRLVELSKCGELRPERRGQENMGERRQQGGAIPLSTADTDEEHLRHAPAYWSRAPRSCLSSIEVGEQDAILNSTDGTMGPGSET